ncbi:hypothetical protein DRW07_10840 [Alteromonas sediminis]|uniref:Translocation and assembly module TamB C-terminal domain-containing protein n=1 Tax=Alteromonas sediminis TaxID=2259342 RepID=A0A3N5XZM6_9ALTE|nr:translocation/assembly module TamB domain-containing protein [Alteromonas sediminis]RPJ66572.1 hypothetical protein DRW07_10840 [Alteromonas sediminis]
MSKRLAYIILIMTAVIGSLSAFIVSPLATPLMKWSANKFVEGLSVEKMSGSLLGNLSLSGIRYRQPGTEVRIETTTLNLDWSCIDADNICIESVTVSRPVITLSNTDADAEDDSVPNTNIELPVRLVIGRIKVTEIQLASSPYSVEISTLTTALTMQDTVSISQLQLRDIAIKDASLPAPETPFAGIQYTAPSLPTVSLPIAVDINDLNIQNLYYEAATSQQSVDLIASSALRAKGETISWQALTIQHTQGQASTSGEIALRDDYRIDAWLSASANIDENTQQSSELQLKGSLANLDFDIELAGLVDGNATLKLNILSDTLPIQGRLNWPAQPVGYASVESLQAGELVVQGEIANYSMQLESGLKESTLGDIRLLVDFVLTDRSFLVNHLDAKLLGGDISTRGKVNFVDGLSGTGFTKAKGITLTRLLQGNQTPQPWQELSLPQAEWQYVLQQRPNGIEVLLGDINAQITQANSKATLLGQAAYSQGNDLGVATLTLSQNNTNNTVGITAQVLNQRFINAKLNLAVQDIATFVAGVEGTIQGDVNIAGEWQNPAFDAHIMAKNIVIPDSLSPELAQQGTLEASFAAEGNAFDHVLNIAFSASDASLQAALNGGYENDAWRGQLSQSLLRIKNTQWYLQAPAALTLHTDNGHVNVGAHCWLLDADPAKACIEQAYYKAKQASAQFEISALPVGAWAKPFVPNLSQVSDSARLQLLGQGGYDSSGKMTATASASINPSTWTFAEENPVILTLENLQSELVLDGNTLDATLDFSSPELGKASAKVHTNITNPNDSTNQVELFLSNITLDPITDLSPSIHQLSGSINGQLLLTGGVRKPNIEGAFTLKNGNVEVEQSPLQLTNWEQELVFNGLSASIEGSLNIGEGQGEISGLIDWSDTPIVNLALEANDIALTHEKSKLTLSPNLNATILPDSVMVSGQVDVPYARIKIDSLPASAVSPSEDVYLRGEPPETDPIKAINADVLITLDERKAGEVKVDAFGLTADLHGGLQILNQPSVVGYGDLQILNGRYQAYGQNLLIRTGEVQFNGPLSQPFLFVEAIRDPQLTEDGVVAGVRIDGAATGPTVELFSEPAMDQNQNLLYLLSGSGNLNASSSEDETAFQTALLGFGLASSGTFTSGVGEALGIEDLSLTTVGQGDNTQVAVSGRIAKNLTLRYGVGVFDNETEIALRYQIIPKLYIEAVRGISLAVDMYYEFAVGELETEPAK